MFEELLPAVPEEETLPYDLLVEKTEGYSGSDIRLLCKEAAMQPLRRVMAILEDQDMLPDDGTFLKLSSYVLRVFLSLFLVDD